MSLLAELASFCIRDFAEEEEDKNRKKKTMPMGPSREDGANWSLNEEDGHHGIIKREKGDAIIKRVVIYSGGTIDSVTFHYELDGEKEEDEELSGKFDLNYPAVEYLTGITVTYSHSTRYWSDKLKFIPNESEQPVLGKVAGRISSLKFVTNLKEYGPFGEVEGSHFKLPVEGGMILGVHGRMDAFLRGQSPCESEMVAVKVHALENFSPVTRCTRGCSTFSVSSALANSYSTILTFALENITGRN